MFETKDLVREKTLAEIRAEKEELFFSKPIEFSFSGLSKLIQAPSVYKKEYIYKERDSKKSKALIEGSLIHHLLLQPKSLPDNYLIQPGKVPIDNPLLIIEKCYLHWRESKTGGCLADFSPEILDHMKELNYFQALVDDKPTKSGPGEFTGDQKRLNKILTKENADYFEFLKKATGKELVSEDTYNYCEMAADAINGNEKCAYLLGLIPSEDIDVINEDVLKIPVEGDGFGFKGFLDSLVFNHDLRIIYINDVKTSGKVLDKFQYSVKEYLYSLQMALYKRLVEYAYASLIKEAGYVIQCHFVVVDVMLNAYPFPVSEETLQYWELELQAALKKARYHISNRDFKLPYDYANNLIQL